MGLFKSKEERRLERNMKVKQALSTIRRQVREQERYAKTYVLQAKEARRLGSLNQFEFLKKAIKKTATVKVRLERQLLALETAAQLKDQAESHGSFAMAMGALSKSIAEIFGTTDLAKTQVDFEKAMSQAQSLEERMDTFLEMTSDSMYGYEGSTEGELVSDADISRMLDDEVAHEEGGGADKTKLDEDLASIEKAIETSKK